MSADGEPPTPAPAAPEVCDAGAAALEGESMGSRTSSKFPAKKSLYTKSALAPLTAAAAS
eukprot:CAMPEP_0172041240 /NCGR_PEP_ID=MMETSP1041-20130122/24944_1 /TAXON_ID=464988 /ORGANISM="Hemiselmis andersenii, Strain CCMP439" /LENGTH=59 /DNA_ID=CAMNT_0012699227 /DNA_START=8 /DNA_END=183 /DNA_ORIENTATION=+